MSTLKQERWPGFARIGMRVVMIVGVVALIVVAALAFIAELTVA